MIREMFEYEINEEEWRREKLIMSFIFFALD
jgi:hypothetical protein